MKQGTKEWLENRKNYIGASDSVTLMGFYKWNTPFQLWQEKLGIKTIDSSSYATEYGKLMEDPARKAYEKFTGNIIDPNQDKWTIYHSTKKFMFANLDGITVGGKIGLEVKNINAEDHAEAVAGRVPKKYCPQVQHQLACLEHDMLHYWSFHKGEGALVIVKRDDKYIETKLYPVLDDFWDKVVTFKEPDLVEEDLRKRGKDWIEAAKIAKTAQEAVAKFKKEADEALAKLKNLSENENSTGGGYVFKRHAAKGSVDYKSIKELEGVNLDDHRKKPIFRWRLSAAKASG